MRGPLTIQANPRGSGAGIPFPGVRTDGGGWEVGSGRHWGMGHHERCRILKAGIHFWKILVSPAGDSWNLVYTGEFTGRMVQNLIGLWAPCIISTS